MPTRAPTPSPPGSDVYRADERACHHELLADGGRPAYAIGLLNLVSRASKTHRNMLPIWSRSEDEMEWRVFTEQLFRWKEFRKWQKENRGIYEEGVEFAADLEARKQRLLRLDEDVQAAELEDQEGLDFFRRFWQEEHRRLQRSVREHHGDGGFPQYVEAVKRRLAAHNFTKAVWLEQDLERQDALATWIEYLNFEYWWDEKFDAEVRQLQPKHDEAWVELRSANVLRPLETSESILSGIGWDERGLKLRRAEDAREKATSDAQSLLDRSKDGPSRSLSMAAERKERLTAALARYKEASKTLELTKRRCDRIADFRIKFRYYWEKRERADRHKAYLRWVLEQVPLVEAEMAEAEAADGSCTGARGPERISVDREHGPSMEAPSSKKKDKKGAGNHRDPVSPGTSPAAHTPLTTIPSKRSREEADGEVHDELPLKKQKRNNPVPEPLPEPRRSARVAAAQQAAHQPEPATRSPPQPASARRGDPVRSVRPRKHDKNKLQPRPANNQVDCPRLGNEDQEDEEDEIRDAQGAEEDENQDKSKDENKASNEQHPPPHPRRSARIAAAAAAAANRAAQAQPSLQAQAGTTKDKTAKPAAGQKAERATSTAGRGGRGGTAAKTRMGKPSSAAGVSKTRVPKMGGRGGKVRR